MKPQEQDIRVGQQWTDKNGRRVVVIEMDGWYVYVEVVKRAIYGLHNTCGRRYRILRYGFLHRYQFTMEAPD